MYKRITFGTVDAARLEQLSRLWHEDLMPVLRAAKGNWRELFYQNDGEPGSIVYFSIWHEKQYADRFDELWGFDRVLDALEPFFVQSPETRIFNTVGYNRPLTPLAEKFK